MVQVLSKLHISVATGSDVEVTLHLVQIQAAKDPARIAGRAPQIWRLGPLGPLAADPHDIMNVLLSETLVMAMHGHPTLAGDDPALLVPVEPVRALLVNPLAPGCGLALEPVSSEDTVAGGVLDVDVQVGALHAHDHVHVDLQVVADALLDREGVRLGAAPPARQLGPDENQRDKDHRHGPLAAARGARYVLGFGFC